MWFGYGPLSQSSEGDRTMYAYLRIPFVGAVYAEISKRSDWGVEREPGEVLIWAGRVHVILSIRDKVQRSARKNL